MLRHHQPTRQQRLCALLLIYNSGGLAHKEGAGVVHGLIINIITQSLEIMLDGNNTLASELLDLRSAVVLPVRDISVVPYPQWSSGEDNRADIVIMASRSHGFLVGLGSTSLISQDETGTPC